MKKSLAIPYVIGVFFLAALCAHADEYEFRRYLSGLQRVSVPDEPTEPIENWTLTEATLPKAITGEAYTFSFHDLITPAGLEGFNWSGQGIPSWAHLNPGTGELTGTPSSSDAGEKSFAITASREDTNGQQVYTIEVGGQTLVVTQIVTGDEHSCALTVAGAVKCWGGNSEGQLGNGSTRNSGIPVSVNGLSRDVTYISSGRYHNCAITSSGAARCWGKNDHGQLGNGSTGYSTVPVSVSGLSSGVSLIAPGDQHTCALTTAGAVKCWGRDNVGQLGNGAAGNSVTPGNVTGLSSGVVSISSGNTHSCAVTTGGAAKCWGYNAFGQLGNGTKTSSQVPVTVNGLETGTQSISGGAFHTCAVTLGRAKCWGYNAFGQLGDNSKTDTSEPVNVATLSGVAAISAGYVHTCAVTTSGSAWCWGYSNYGQLGNTPKEDSLIPAQVTGLGDNVSGIHAGRDHSCAVTTDGATKCWGHNGYGQLGNNSGANSSTPVDVLPPAQ